jgi:4-hydroxy-tetrahydrodipicolinate reductase
LNIALFGYGKMGHMIEEIAHHRGHTIVLKIDVENRESLTREDLQNADAAIEFTAPHSAVANIRFCLDAGVPVIVGTTGWYDQFESIKQEVSDKKGSLVYASNFSVGVNMLFAMNRLLAKWMNNYPEYDVEVKEIHHTQKLDSPSGTAITLAEGILENVNRKKSWEKQEVTREDKFEDQVLKIQYAREDGVPGIHSVTYTSDIDQLRISHEAFSRKGFAFGAVLAAEFIKNKKGIFTANDIFGF